MVTVRNTLPGEPVTFLVTETFSASSGTLYHKSGVKIDASDGYYTLGTSQDVDCSQVTLPAANSSSTTSMLCTAVAAATTGDFIIGTAKGEPIGTVGTNNSRCVAVELAPGYYIRKVTILNGASIKYVGYCVYFDQSDKMYKAATYADIVSGSLTGSVVGLLVEHMAAGTGAGSYSEAGVLFTGGIPPRTAT
jgi:hypothetical protein